MEQQPEQNWVQQNEQDMGLEDEESSSSSSQQQQQEDDQELQEENEEESQPESEQQQPPEEEAPPLPPASEEHLPSAHIDHPPNRVPPFDPSRMIGIIRRKSLIKELAATYHAECLSYCQELLELQRKGDEPLVDFKYPDQLKDVTRPPKRSKKTARH